MYYNLLPINIEDSIEKYIAKYIEMSKAIQQIVPNVFALIRVVVTSSSKDGC
jgi:hypothetical protein